MRVLTHGRTVRYNDWVILVALSTFTRSIAAPVRTQVQIAHKYKSRRFPSRAKEEGLSRAQTHAKRQKTFKGTGSAYRKGKPKKDPPVPGNWTQLMPPPVVIGGIGGSGTRGVREAALFLGVRMCSSSSNTAGDARVDIRDYRKSSHAVRGAHDLEEVSFLCRETGW